MNTITITLSKTGAKGTVSVDPWICNIDAKVDSGEVEWVLAGNQQGHFDFAIEKTSAIQKWPFAGKPGGKPDKKRYKSGRLVKSKMPGKLPWHRRYKIHLRGRWGGSGQVADVVLDPDMQIDDSGRAIRQGKRRRRRARTGAR